jgi:hypothetical protein
MACEVVCPLPLAGGCMLTPGNIYEITSSKFTIHEDVMYVEASDARLATDSLDEGEFQVICDAIRDGDVELYSSALVCRDEEVFEEHCRDDVLSFFSYEQHKLLRKKG